MEETLRAIMEEQRSWLQQQIQDQNANIAANQQRMLDQQQQINQHQHDEPNFSSAGAR